MEQKDEQAEVGDGVGMKEPGAGVWAYREPLCVLSLRASNLPASFPAGETWAREGPSQRKACQKVVTRNEAINRVITR